MKIVLAIDGSASSEGALHLLKNLPISPKEIILLHVKPSVMDSSLVLSTEAQKEFEKFNREIDENATTVVSHGEKLLSGSAARIKQVIIVGNPAEKILEYLDEHKTDLVVMGARGHNPVQSFFIGSVADTVTRHAHCSILLFRGKDTKGAKLPKKLTLAVGYDDSPSARKALHHLRSWDQNKISRINLVCYAQMSFYYGMTYSLAILSSWPLQKKSLEEGIVAAEAEFAKAHSPAVISSEIIVDTHDIAHELNAYAVKHHCDVIVVGSKGKNLLDRIMLGSVSNKLAHHADLPVLIVRRKIHKLI